jgi:daunosaminyl-N,N-dimethyltransferase/N-dimethyltransferase
MDEERLYGDRAGLYDPIYHFVDYAGGAARLHEVLASEGIADGGRFLEGACGTGSFLDPLSRWYMVAGFDRSPEMLAVARGKLPETPLFEADLAGFEVDRPFDAAGCLFSSIGYLHTDAALAGCARSFARALRPGGVLLIEPWIFRENWREGEPHLQTYESPDLKLCRANVSRSEGDFALLDFHWLVVRQNRGVEHFSERHRLRFWPLQQMEGALGEAGFEVRFIAGGRGLIIGRRR